MKKRKRGSNIVSMGNDGEYDPVTHNAFRVEAGVADNRANSRAHARRRTHGLLPRSRKVLHRGAGPLAERVIERSGTTHHQSGFLVPVTYIHRAKYSRFVADILS